MKITMTTEVVRELFSLRVTTEAKALGQTYKHVEGTDLTPMYELFLDQMIKDGWIQEEEGL